MARQRDDAGTEMVRTLRRILLAGLSVIALALFALWRIDSPRVEILRMAAADRMAPLLGMTAAPLGRAVALIENWESQSALHRQNRDLRREIERLRAWREAAQQLERENARLRALNNVQLSPRLAFATAEVLADPRGPFGRSVLVSVGARDGVTDGSAVVDGNGLVGRVVGVGEGVSRVLLLTDFASRVPVRVMPSGQRGVLVGDGTAAPRLDFVAEPAAILPGSQIVTSGEDGVFPADLAVGMVTRGDERSWRVVPAADYRRLDFVRILRWQRETPQALPPALVGIDAPPWAVEPEPMSVEPPAPRETDVSATPLAAAEPGAPRPVPRPGN